MTEPFVMMRFLIYFFLLSMGIVNGFAAEGHILPLRVADKPLFRDPICDGAADPVVIWNEKEQCWFMFYTNRRASDESLSGVAWVHGTRIGVATSIDGGASWRYRGVCSIEYNGGEGTHWAPEVIEHDGVYHMYLTYVPGVFEDWSHPRQIVHLTSSDMMQWAFQSELILASDRVIDACVFRLPNGHWRMYYNNERDGKSIYSADSSDLYHWTDHGEKVVDDRGGEGPKVFKWKGQHWLIVDNWDGLGVYSSPDMVEWTRQQGNLLREPGAGLDDCVMASHADVVVSGERAFIFYFTHPGRTPLGRGVDAYSTRRSSLQVAELKYVAGALRCDRDQAVDLRL